MAEKSKASEFEKAIKAKRAELEKVQREKQEAADNPERLVLAEKRERRISDQIKGLERAMATAAYRPPEPTDREELLQGFKKYVDEKAAKVQKVQDSISTAEAERESISREIQQAAEDCDAEKTVELSEKRAENESRLKHLLEMRERVSAFPVFPEGAAAQELADICKKVLPDWKKSALQVETLAAAYKAACRDFMTMYDTLKSVRDEISRMEAAQGYTQSSFPPVFTAGLDTSKLALQKGDYIRLSGIANPFTGAAL